MTAYRDVCCDGLYYEPDHRCERATFGMGCFYSPEAIFGLVKGVVRTRVAYTGGTHLNPTTARLFDYTAVVDVEFDPFVTNFAKMLNIFWRYHDPTLAANRENQSAIYYHTAQQRDLADLTLRCEVDRRNKPIKTKIFPAKEIYEAEECHQKYFLQKYPYILECLDIKVGMPLVRSKLASRLNGYCGGFGSLACFESEWKNLGLCCEVVDYIRKIIAENYREKIGC